MEHMSDHPMDWAPPPMKHRVKYMAYHTYNMTSLLYMCIIIHSTTLFYNCFENSPTHGSYTGITSFEQLATYVSNMYCLGL